MITFRALPPNEVEYDDLSFAGENEELLAHLTARMLAGAGWIILVARDGGTEELLDDDWLDS